MLDDRDALRTAMATLSIVLPEESGLHGEAILFDSGTLVDRANGEAVEPSEIG